MVEQRVTWVQCQLSLSTRPIEVGKGPDLAKRSFKCRVEVHGFQLSTVQPLQGAAFFGADNVVWRIRRENVAKIEMGVSDLRIPGGNHMHIDVKGCVPTMRMELKVFEPAFLDGFTQSRLRRVCFIHRSVTAQL